MSTKPVIWQSVDNDNVVAYAANDSAALEASYKAGHDSHRLQFGSAVVTVVFAEMQEHNASGGHRRVIRMCDEPPVPLVPTKPSLAKDAAGAAAAGASGVVVTAGVQAAASALVPTAMSYFGTVVAGVGTITTSGGVVATLQAVSMVATPVLIPAVVGVGIYGGLRYVGIF